MKDLDQYYDIGFDEVCERLSRYVRDENIIKDQVNRYIEKYPDNMMHIRPVSELRNNFTEIESVVKEGSTVYLTKNGYGTTVVMKGIACLC